MPELNAKNAVTLLAYGYQAKAVLVLIETKWLKLIGKMSKNCDYYSVLLSIFCF